MTTQNIQQSYPEFRLAKLAILLLALVYVITRLIAAHQPSGASNSALDNEETSFHYPDVVYIPFVAQDKWSFSFSEAERILRNIRLEHKKKRLIIDKNTERWLVQILASLPSELAEDDMERVKFLINRTAVHQVGAELSQLLTQYYDYIKKLNKFEQRARKEEPLLIERMAVTNKARIAYQHEFFGQDIQKKLFFRTNLDNEYFLQRQRVLSDRSLSTEHKEQRLNEIVRVYKMELRKLRDI